jgi:hypothetical protein
LDDGKREIANHGDKQFKQGVLEMKKVFLVFVAILVCGLPVFAQEYPKSELFMGYEMVRFNPSLAGNENATMNGGGGSISYNVSPMFGLKAEFTGAGAGNQKICSSTGLNCVTQSANFFSYLFGPQITLSRGKAQPFVHLLFGGAYSNYYANVAQAGTISTGSTTADTGKHAFALAAGVGLDVKVSKHVAIRVAQLDYFMTRFSGREIASAGTGSIGGKEINNQNNWRYLGGLVFHLGNTQ